MKCIKTFGEGKIALLLLSGAMTILAGCSSDENYYDPDYAVKQYNASWEKTFGEIDPDQTWNMAVSKTMKVTTNESGLVSVYTKGLDESYVLAKALVSAGAVTPIKFDVPSDMSGVYVVLSSESGRTCKEVSVSDDAVTFNGAKAVRSTVTALKAQRRRRIDYVNGLYHPDNLSKDYSQIYDATQWGDFYATNEWPVCTRHNLYAWGEYNMSIDYEQVDVNGVYPDIAEIQAVLDKAENNNTFQEYAKNITLTTQSAGEIALTFIQGKSSASSAIGYFYTNAEASESDMMKAPKYVLIPASHALEVGNKIKLTYYGEDGEDEPTFTFPKGVTVHFFLARGNNGNVGADRLKSDEYDYYVMNGTLQLYSDKNLSTLACENMRWTVISATAAYSAHSVNIISFEDWPDSGTATDYNDIAFAVTAPFDNFESVDGEYAWTIAYEDLGSTNDFDFNDVVLRVTKKWTENYVNGTLESTASTLNVDLCAAGGTLNTKVYYGDEDLGEVHEKFGVPTGTMVNTGNGSANKDIVTLLSGEEVDKDFTIADNALQFKIVVSGDDTKTVGLPSSNGVAPQAICVSGKWAWPTERTNISDAYTNFGAWGANYTTNKDWYQTPVSENVIVK